MTIAENNIKVVQAGFDYGHNTHASVPATYRIESKEKVPGRYMDITGNKATAYGLIAAAEKAGLRLYLGSYPITPATDIPRRVVTADLPSSAGPHSLTSYRTSAKPMSLKA